jgi:hypothetical protein
MAQNSKTRLFVFDGSNSTPFGFSLQTEFDVYQEAVDYAINSVTAIQNDVGGTAHSFVIYLYSYNNPSYRIRTSATGVQIIEVAFP